MMHCSGQMQQTSDARAGRATLPPSGLQPMGPGGAGEMLGGSVND